LTIPRGIDAKKEGKKRAPENFRPEREEKIRVLLAPQSSSTTRGRGRGESVNRAGEVEARLRRKNAERRSANFCVKDVRIVWSLHLLRYTTANRELIQ